MPPRGTRDFFPIDQQKKNWVIDRIREVYEVYGFEPLGTPAFEYLEMLKLKSGDDIVDQIYDFKDKSDRELALRFELTASTVRLVASHRNLVKPFKRYAIGPVWRYERPSETRFREFWQADVDIYGVEGSIADAEVLSAAVDALSVLGFEGFIININDRRIIKRIVELCGVHEERIFDAFRVIDKLGKIGRESVIKELRGISPDDETSVRLLDMLDVDGSPSDVFTYLRDLLEDSPSGLKGCQALEDLFMYSKGFGFSEYLRVDLSLVRGLDYYTGPVFEVIAEGFEEYGSIAGGGRYDEIVELFGGQPTFATGVSFGIDRVTPILDMKGVFDELSLGAGVFVAPVNSEQVINAIEIAQMLRVEGISTRVDMMGRKLGKQFQFADKKNVSYIVIVGEREFAESSVTVRDMRSGDETLVKIDDLVSFLQ